jgi:DNA-binding transcriptional MerR regulator
MDKAPEAFLTIGEMAKRLGVRTHILRYWEEQFPMLQPLKRAGGRRLYRPSDVELVEQIQDLLDRKGFTIRGACLHLRNGSAMQETPERLVSVPPSARETITPAIVHELRNIRSRLAAALTAA